MLYLLQRAFLACALIVTSAAYGAEVSALPQIVPDEVEGLALPELEARVAKGDLKAQAQLGARYGRGAGVAVDLPKAIALIADAAEKDEPTAQYYLGLSYMTGAGVEQDLTRARAWYEKSAKHDHAGAQYQLGVMMTSGQGGFEQDPAAAVPYILKSANQGYMPAALRMGEMYQSGYGVEKSYELAALWFRRILKTGYHKAAAVRLAVLIDTEAVKQEPGDPGTPTFSQPK